MVVMVSGVLAACTAASQDDLQTGIAAIAPVITPPKTLSAALPANVLSARAAGLPFPGANPTFISQENAKALAAFTTRSAPPGAQSIDEELASPVSEKRTGDGTQTPALAFADESGVSVQANSDAEKSKEAADLNHTAHAEQVTGNAAPQVKKLASLPGVVLRTTPEVKRDDDIPSAAEIIAKSRRAFLPTLSSYAAFAVANDRVETKCFPGRLRKILELVHQEFGRRPEVNSGYRSVAYNRRIGGSRGSYHTKCQAADIKVRGVDKYRLARYLRSLPNIGGVGVYGCKGVVHVDIGPRRDWYYRCRKRRA